MGRILFSKNCVSDGDRSAAESSKHQAPNTREAPILKLQNERDELMLWSLEIDVSLELGVWLLELVMRSRLSPAAPTHWSIENLSHYTDRSIFHGRNRAKPE